jgi:superoxide dismutase, Fe-Mn family
MEHKLPKLPYDYAALEPHFDEATMRVHHTKHHQAYTDKFNAALQKHPQLIQKGAEEIIQTLSEVPEDVRQAVRNNGGGYINHTFFWESLTPENQEIPNELKIEIEKVFGGIDEFKEKFSEAALTLFGSGWAWLVINNGKLEIMQTHNQGSPLTEGKFPLLNLDVWEHAYYLKYQNKRPDFIKAFWNVVNWNKVSKRLMEVKNG